MMMIEKFMKEVFSKKMNLLRNYIVNSFEKINGASLMCANKALILNGRIVSDAWNGELKIKANKIEKIIGRKAHLSAILVGDRMDSKIYVDRKKMICHEVGVDMTVHNLNKNITQIQLENKIKSICNDDSTDGILVQLPLPRHLDEESIMDALEPSKDVDGFHALNMGRMLMKNRIARFVPCTPLGCLHLLKGYNIEIANKTVVIVGDSNIVGTPLSVLLRDEDAAIVTVCHGICYKEWFEDETRVEQMRSAALACNPVIPGPFDKLSIYGKSLYPANKNPHLPSITKTADILVVAIGLPHFIKADWIKPGAVVIDVGINVLPIEKTIFKHRNNYNKEYKIVGDVDFDEVSKIASAITPVPGGVGPMTISAVVHNTIQAAEYRFLDIDVLNSQKFH